MPTRVANIVYNRKSNTYHNHSGKHKIHANDLNHQYIMALKWSYTIDTIRSSEILTMVGLIEKHIDIDAHTFEWMHPLAFSAKSNSDDNPM